MERPIDSRVLLYVLTVAEEGNITRAAKRRLFIAPGSLARDIRNLERRIGYPLFARQWGGVALTPAGTVFMEEARRSLDHSRRAADRGAAASRGETGTLKVGVTPLFDAARLVEIRQRFAKMMPEIKLDFRSVYCSAQVDLILREVLDAGLTLLPPVSNEVSARCLWRTRLVVAIPESASLALPEPVALRTLSRLASVCLARDVSPALYDRLRDTCLNSGCMPNIVHEAMTYDEMLDAVSSGLGVGFVKESTARRMQIEGVVFRRFEDERVSVEIGVVYRPEKSALALKAFLQALTELSDCSHKSSPQIRLG